MPFYLLVARRQWFWGGEWTFLADRDLTSFHDLVRPYHQHWETIPVLVFQGLYAAFGVATYVPYQLGVIVLHAGAGVLLWIVMRRSGVRAWLATLAAAGFILFGNGRQDVVLAFQFGFDAALVLGLIALLLVDHGGPLDRRDAAALVCSLLALLCSGVAITMIFVSAIVVFRRRGYRSLLLYVVPLIAVYLAWYLGFARADFAQNDYSSVSSVVHTVADLIRATLVAIGSSGLVALALGGVVIVGVAVACRNRSLDGRWLAPLAMAAGALQFLAATAYGRAATGPNPVKQGRYLDIAACLLLPLISLAGETIARLDRRAAVGVFAVFALGIPANVRAAGPSDGAPADRAAFVALAESPLLGQVDPEHRPDLERFPSVTTGWLIAAVRRSGLPPGPAPDASTRASADLLLSLQQLALQHPVPPCEPLTGPVTLSLREHDLVSYMAAGIDVSAATPDGAGTVTYHPTAGAIGGTLRAALPILDVTIRPSFKVPGVLCIRPSSRRD